MKEFQATKNKLNNKVINNLINTNKTKILSIKFENQKERTT